jgi:hypothetical protein
MKDSELLAKLEQYKEKIGRYHRSAIQGCRDLVALGEILEEVFYSKLYKQEFSTFDEWCNHHWGWTANYVGRLRRAARFVGSQKLLSDTGHEVQIPKSESEARRLSQKCAKAQPVIDVSVEIQSNLSKPMGARQCGEVEHVIPPQPPAALEPTHSPHPVPASPLIADKVNQIVREALRLQTPNGPEAFFSPPFRHLLAQLVGLQKMIQPPLPGMEEHLAEPSAAKKARATLPEIIAFVTSSEINLPESDAKAFFYHMESQGWKVNRMAVKDWKMTVRKWQEYGYMASQKRAQSNGHGKPQETHWKTKELDAELAQLRKEEAEFEKRSAALRRPK